MFLEILRNSQESICARASPLTKSIKRETLAQVFSCKFCEISKNTFFYKTHLVAAFGFIREYSYVKHIPYLDFLKLSQKTQFQNTLLTKNLFRLNIFAIYFPLKLIVFTAHIFSIRAFSLYETKVIFAFMKRTDVDHFYRKCVIEYWLIG